MDDEAKADRTNITSPPESSEPSPNGKLPEVRDAAWERYQEVKRKVFALSDGLLRKLAEYDRQH